MAEQNQQSGSITPEEARQELTASQTNPQHPMYSLAQRGMPAYNTWAEGLYKRIGGGAAKVAVTPDGMQGAPVVPGTVEDTREPESILKPESAPPEGPPPYTDEFKAAVAQELKDREVDQADVTNEAKILFKGQVGKELLDHFDDQLLAFVSGSDAERTAHVEMARFLADLADLRSGELQTEGGESFSDADLTATLARMGYRQSQLVEIQNNLFMGRPELLKHLQAHLNSFPPRVRMAAYVRAAQALTQLSRLQQTAS